MENYDPQLTNSNCWEEIIEKKKKEYRKRH